MPSPIRVTAFESRFDDKIYRTEALALRHDLDFAIGVVIGASPQELRTAARRGKGSLFDCMQFLVGVKYDLDSFNVFPSEAVPAAAEPEGV